MHLPIYITTTNIMDQTAQKSYTVKVLQITVYNNLLLLVGSLHPLLQCLIKLFCTFVLRKLLSHTCTRTLPSKNSFMLTNNSQHHSEWQDLSVAIF